MRNFRILAAAGAAVLLAGCPGRPELTASPQFACVELKQYSRSEQAAIADQLEAHASAIPAVAAAIDDYGSLRAAIRKVCGKRSGARR